MQPKYKNKQKQYQKQSYWNRLKDAFESSKHSARASTNLSLASQEQKLVDVSITRVAMLSRNCRSLKV